MVVLFRKLHYSDGHYTEVKLYIRYLFFLALLHKDKIILAYTCLFLPELFKNILI